MPKYSFIIPIYNVEDYLRQCLDSIVTQQFDDYEAILIDDGSTDSSSVICDEYAERYSQLKAIHKENGGVSSARNAGLDVAKGEWIWFVDADDWIVSSSLSSLCQVIKNQPDIKAIVFGVNRVLHGLTYNLYTPSSTLSIYSNIEKFCCNIPYRGEVWCWLFNRTVIEQKHLRFSEGLKYGEDGEFTFKYIVDVTQILSIPDVFYVQYDRPDSAMNTKFQYSTIINHEVILRNLIEYVYERNISKSKFVKFIMSTQLEHYLRCLIHAPLSEDEEEKCKNSILNLTTANLSLFSVRAIIKVYMYPLYKRIAK